MDYTQRYHAECADVKQTGDENQDVVLLIPNFSLMERFFVNGGKDPWFFYKRIMETVYPPHTKKSSNLLEELSLEVETRKLNNEWQEESKGLFGLKKESMPLEEDNILSWFDRNEFNCGALRLPISTEDLFIFLKDRHLNFFESMIQANIRKEAEDIPLIAFQFWTNEKIAEQLESETLKFLYSDLSSLVSECQTGLIPLMLAIIKVKKAIDLLPRYEKKEDFVDRKLQSFRNLPIEDQREHLISEQENVLISLNLPNKYIMNLIKLEFEKDSFIVEPKLYRQRKNIIRIYKCLQVLIERKYEIFMNLILFQNIIVKFWDDKISQDMLLLLIRAGMVLTNIRIWRDFIITRDSGIVPLELDLKKKSKKTQKDKTPKTNPIEVLEKDSEDTVLIEDSEETEKTTDQEQITLQKQPKYLECEAQSSLKFSQIGKFQEIISISSDSEEETKSEPKNSDRDLWKFRLPKKSSKYVPETRKDEESKNNDSWLSKRYPVEFEKNAHAIKSFRDDMMSKDTYSLERSNTRISAVMHQSSSLMAKPSSFTDISPSHLSSPFH